MANYFSNRYPYTDFHELNLDWIIKKMRELEIDMDEFKVVNNITFSGQWDITKQYPAWTIVSDNNIGYVSLKPVPVGVPLTNGSYWVEVIDYTAQIAGLESRVIAIENDITNNIKPDILTNAAGIADINHRIKMNERTFLFVGDSYASQTETWVNPLVTFAGIQNYDNVAVTGTGFLDGTFNNQILHYTGNRNAVTDIVVGGGLNDSVFDTINADANTVKNNMELFAIYAKKNYPNARLWLAYMGNALDDASLLAGKTWNKRSWCKWLYEFYGRQYGFYIISGCDIALAKNNSTFKADHIHPNASGAVEIAVNIANVLCNGQNATKYPYFSNSMTAVGNNILTGGTCKYSLNGEMFDVSIEDLWVKIETDHHTFTGGTEIELVTMGSLYFNRKCFFTVTGILLNFNSRGYLNAPMQLIFDGNKIKVKVLQTNSNGTAYQTYTADSGNAAIFINPELFTIPAAYIN